MSISKRSYLHLSNNHPGVEPMTQCLPSSAPLGHSLEGYRSYLSLAFIKPTTVPIKTIRATGISVLGSFDCLSITIRRLFESVGGVAAVCRLLQSVGGVVVVRSKRVGGSRQLAYVSRLEYPVR